MYTISTVTAVQSVLGDLGLVAVAYLLAFTMGHGSGWLDCIAVTANTTNYPTAKGQATGITKCIFGVAAPTITLLFITFNGTQSDSSPLSFLLLVVMMVLIIIPLSALFIAIDPSLCPSGDVCNHIFGRINALGLTLALVQLLDFFLGVPKWVGLLLVVLLFALMVAYPLRAERLVNNPSEYAAISPAMARSDFLYYYSGDEPLKSILFWEAFIGLSAAYGGGLAFINNQAQIIPSADTTDRAHIVGALLTTVTATSAASRVITGWAADRLTFLSRPGYVVLLIAIMAAAFTVGKYFGEFPKTFSCSQLLSKSTTVSVLFLSGPLIGFCFGGMWALTPPLCADLFGEHNLPVVYSSMRGTLLVGKPRGFPPFSP